MKAVLAEFWMFLLENFKWIIPTTVGMGAKLAIDSRNKRLTWRDILIKITIGFFSGFVVSWYLINHGMEKTAMWATPLATMSGESVILFLSTNSSKYYRFFSKKWLGMKDEDLDDKTNEQK